MNAKKCTLGLQVHPSKALKPSLPYRHSDLGPWDLLQESVLHKQQTSDTPSHAPCIKSSNNPHKALLSPSWIKPNMHQQTPQHQTYHGHTAKYHHHIWLMITINSIFNHNNNTNNTNLILITVTMQWWSPLAILDLWAIRNRALVWFIYPPSTAESPMQSTQSIYGFKSAPEIFKPFPNNLAGVLLVCWFKQPTAFPSNQPSWVFLGIKEEQTKLILIGS